LLPPIPDRPADRPETWSEYLSRRAIVAMHRQFADEFAAWLKEERLDPQKVTVFDAFRYFTDMAGNRVPFSKTKGQPIPLTYGTKRVPTNTVFIDEDVTWREDAVRRLLADPSATNVMFTDVGVPDPSGVSAVFTDAGVLQATRLDIDLAPELKELSGPRKRRAGTNPTS